MPDIEERPRPPIADPLTPTIFHEPWWLETVTRGRYEKVELLDNGRTVGRLYYFPRRRGGLKYSIMPPMTHFLGPSVIDDGGGHSTRFLRKANIMQELIRRLPPASIYQYKCHRDITDAIVFQQEQFHTAVQFTYEIMPDSEEALWKNMRTEKRKKIRSAERSLTVTDMHDPREFLRFYDENLRKRGNKNVCDQEICSRLIEGCLSRDRGRIYAAFDKNRLTAAVFCMWDETSSYYFMSTRAPNAHHGAISLLAWEAMKEASRRGLIFDFDGLNNSKAVLFFTEFGGTIGPRFIVTRKTFLGNCALGIKNMRRENRYFY